MKTLEINLKVYNTINKKKMTITKITNKIIMAMFESPDYPVASANS
jgi:hypothetical protein